MFSTRDIVVLPTYLESARLVLVDFFEIRYFNIRPSTHHSLESIFQVKIPKMICILGWIEKNKLHEQVPTMFPIRKLMVTNSKGRGL